MEDPDDNIHLEMKTQIQNNESEKKETNKVHQAMKAEIEKRDGDYDEVKQRLFKCARSKEPIPDEHFRTLKLDVGNFKFKELVKEIDERGNTALHYAAKAGNLEICKWLYLIGADINARGQNKMKALQFAARYGDELRVEEVWSCIQWIMEEYDKQAGQKRPRKDDKEANYDVCEKDKYDFTILHHAIQNTNWEECPVVVKNLIKTKRFRITEKDKQGNTSLHLAAQFDKQQNHKVFDVFFDNEDISPDDLQSCIKTPNLQGMTPLHIACSIGNHDSVEQLLKESRDEADIEVQMEPDVNGSVPLNLAIESKNKKMLEILIKKGIGVSEDSILTAARTGDVDLMVMLQKAKKVVSVRKKSRFGLTQAGNVFTEEAVSGKRKPRLALNQAVSTEEVPQHSAHSPLFEAAQYNQKKMVEHLLEKDPEQNTSNSNGVTPLMISLKEGNSEIIRILLKACGNNLVTEKDNTDRNVFHYAFDSRAPEEVTRIIVDFVHTCFGDVSAKTLKDLLTAKDLNEDTPIHSLADQRIAKNSFLKIFNHLDQEGANVVECMKEKNFSKETPLHRAALKEETSFADAVIEFGKDSASLEHLLAEKDENSNTALHLATHSKHNEKSPLLKFVKNNREPVRFLAMRNIFGWTPFSCAVVTGDLDVVKEMLKDLLQSETKMLVNQPDYSNTSPLHLAAKYGHVGVFNLLLENGADITRRGPVDQRTRSQQTPLDMAIDEDKRAIILAIIKGSLWKEAFKMPSTTEAGTLDTPLRKLIRRFPDLAEEFLDKCYDVEVKQTREAALNEPNVEEEDVIIMNYDFIEDTHKYEMKKGNKKQDREFFYVDNPSKQKQKAYVVDIKDHPLMIMADERKVDLLQHPLCLAILLRKWSMYGRRFYVFQLCFYIFFLITLNTYILTSPSPIEHPELFNCTDFFKGETGEQNQNISADAGWTINDAFRILLLLVNFFRIVFFFLNREYTPVLNTLRKLDWKRPKLPIAFIFDFIVYSLAMYIAIHHFSFSPNGVRSQVRSCFQWQVSAITITLAWVNLLIYMRLLYGIGKFVILFTEVVGTFFAVSYVFIILLMAFSLGFHTLLSHRENFMSPKDALLKTMIMMSGEIEYGDIFFKEKPPAGFGPSEWDLGHEPVPFPFLTYSLFVVFFFMLSIVALNVLVGLTVDDIRNFLEDADLRKLSMRLKFVLEMERHYIHKMKTQVIDPKITRKSHFELPYTNDLISKAKIWEKIEKKQEERRKKAELEEERRNIKDLIDGQTKTLSDMKTSPDTVFSDMSDIKSKLKSLEEMMTKMKSTIDQNQSKG